jgi:hypothetical protein
MQTYKVIGNVAILGVGLVLKLTQAQATTRSNLLKKKKDDIYIVLEPVQFKQGEIVTVVSGNVSKAVMANLEATSKIQKKEQQKTVKSAPKKDSKKKLDSASEKDEDEILDINPDENNDLQSENDDEKIIDNGDINNLPITTRSK